MTAAVALSPTVMLKGAAGPGPGGAPGGPAGGGGGFF